MACEMIDLTENYNVDNIPRFRVFIPDLPLPMAPLSETIATAISLNAEERREESFRAANELAHDYFTLVKHNEDVFANPGVEGYFSPAPPREDPEVLANVGSAPKIMELHVRIAYQESRRRKLEREINELDEGIDALLVKKHKTIRKLVNARLEENYHRICLDVVAL